MRVNRLDNLKGQISKIELAKVNKGLLIFKISEKITSRQLQKARSLFRNRGISLYLARKEALKRSGFKAETSLNYIADMDSLTDISLLKTNFNFIKPSHILTNSGSYNLHPPFIRDYETKIVLIFVKIKLKILLTLIALIKALRVQLSP